MQKDEKLSINKITNYQLFSNNCKLENNFSAGEINSLKAHMSNKGIIIQKADKGNTIVITDKEKYTEGVKRVISDSNKFVQLNITPKNTSNKFIFINITGL